MLTRHHFLTILLSVSVVLVVALIAVGSGVYADWASCTRGNTQRQADRVEAANLRAGATSLRKRADFQAAGLAELDMRRATVLDRNARQLDLPKLSCTIVAPQVR
jgi:hypothetical protein